MEAVLKMRSTSACRLCQKGVQILPSARISPKPIPLRSQLNSTPSPSHAETLSVRLSFETPPQTLATEYNLPRLTSKSAFAKVAQMATDPRTHSVDVDVWTLGLAIGQVMAVVMPDNASRYVVSSYSDNDEREADRWASSRSSMIPSTKKNARKVSGFSSELRQYFVEGHVNGTPVEALPDSGADMCFISLKLASGLGLDPAAGTQKRITLANKKHVQSPGMVEVPWRFAREQKAHILNCWILPGCVHDLVLGNRFLRVTQTLTKFKNRIKSKLVELPRRLRLRLLGEEKQRLWGSLDGHLTAALPDTGSDVMLISGAYARKIGLTIDRDFENWLEVEFADGTTDWTSGVVRDVPWNVGGETVRCDFHVLDDLCVDVILSKNYLFDLSVFSEHSECLFDADSEEDLLQLCNIRLIGRYSDTLNVLEEEYLEDVTSPDAFGPEMVQRELARRDKIRDEILAYPESKREAATQAEAERQRRWQDLRQAHRTRWRTASSVLQSSNRHDNAHRTETDSHRTRASEGPPTEDVAGGDGLQGAATRRELWKKTAGTIFITLRSLRRSTRA